ncbi:hypothetical protein EST38_g4958 [Candolleomyces aberdarensis]|uniref:Transcription factor spt8 beta-propeller domain-containing protein n=1 Tax=Candolleomyces aberdarensis TaxID=2316362 RepID=A0A4Q2DPW7_9AGAR|nr:hypothetical protein EST38_g4958 [Candolleomyces aberdarensis]
MNAHMSPGSDSDDDDLELDIEDDADGDGEEVGTNVAEDITEEGDDVCTQCLNNPKSIANKPQDSNTDSSTSEDDDDDDDDNENDDQNESNDIDNDMESRLQQELQESLAMEVEAELDAEANELNAALLDAEHSSSSLQLTTSSETLDGNLPGSELPPLPIPRLPSQEAAEYGAVEGLIKAGQLKFWWENPAMSEKKGYSHFPGVGPGLDDEAGVDPVYSLLMHSDALWALAGTRTGHINLFTVRHEPGRLIHVLNHHSAPVSAMSMDYGEKGFFSASWDGEAIQWDLNTGSNVRNFVAHHSQLTSIAVRPAYSGPYFDPTTEPVAYRRKGNTSNATPAAKATAAAYSQDNSASTTQVSATNGTSAPATQSDQHTSLLDVSMPSPGDAHETSSLFGDDPPEPMDTQHSLGDPTLGSPVHHSQPGQAARPDGAPGAVNPDGDDAKSEGSYDSLFGDDGDDNESNEKPAPVGGQPPQTTQAAERPVSKNPYAPLASAYQTSAPTSQFVTFPVGLSNPPETQQTQHGQSPYYSTQTFSVQLPKQQQQQQNVVQPYQPPQSAPSVVPSRQALKQAVAIPPPKNAPPLLDRSGYSNFSSDLLMTAYVDGQVILWDRRVSSLGKGVGRLWMSEKTPPWCLSACWSPDGGQIYAGRRNGTVDVWDVRLMGKDSMTDTPRLLKTLRNPTSSGVVSCLAPLPDCRHVVCASVDNIRLWNVADTPMEDSSMARSRSGVPFKIIPGHHGGYISQMHPSARFLVTASSNRGWHGESTRTVFVHDIKLLY